MNQMDVVSRLETASCTLGQIENLISIFIEFWINEGVENPSTDDVARCMSLAMRMPVFMSALESAFKETRKERRELDEFIGALYRAAKEERAA
jgi:hypothetical protein